MLSDRQKEAVNSIEGQTMVLSCPGSGKTTVIIERALVMVGAGIDPRTMLTITFTKAAADEMKARFSKKSRAAVNFSTIHAFCYRLLCDRYGFDKDSILKQSDQWMFVAENLRKTGVAPNQMDELVKEVVTGISYCKNCEITPAEYETDKLSKDMFISLCRKYESYKKEKGLIDFDDMLILFRDKLREDKNLLEYCQQTYRYITIDEFQDTNKIQADIFYMIAGKDGNIFIVGDDDQSIYSFRAAKSSIMLDFPKTYPNCRIVRLSTNYRSGKKIIERAGNLISHNKMRYDKEFLSARDEEGSVMARSYEDSMQQAKDIAERIKAYHQKGSKYEDFAILFRINSLALPFTKVLMDEKVPFYMTERISGIHEDAIFTDIKTYFRLATGSEKKGDLQKILNRPSRYLTAKDFKDCPFEKKEILKRCEGKKDYVIDQAIGLIQDVEQLRNKTPEMFIAYMENVMGYRAWLKKNAEYFGRQPEDSYQVFDSLKEEAAQFETMGEWFSYAEGYENTLRLASQKKNKFGVCLSTFHGAKGLEWKRVYIVNANEGITPYNKAVSMEAFEEERRMFYVAATRAKDDLRIAYVDAKNSIPSQFIAEMGLTVPKGKSKARSTGKIELKTQPVSEKVKAYIKKRNTQPKRKDISDGPLGYN